MTDLPILFIDATAMVIDKPAGLAVDPPRNGDPSVMALADQLRLGFARTPTPVHRLDRDTSGCLLLARNPRAHKWMQQAFEQGAVQKSYLAIVDGIPVAAEGLIDLALIKRSTAEQGWRIVPDQSGKPAITRWRRLAVHQGRALLLLQPETGRTHQLRVHLASGLGLPIVGDPIYGRRDPQGMMLHAARLSLPRAGKADLDVSAPYPQRFAAAGFAAPADQAG